MSDRIHQWAEMPANEKGMVFEKGGTNNEIMCQGCVSCATERK